jgi:hypothetical protein
MKKAIQWMCLGALAASGALVFACGGGGSESAPANAGSASDTQPPSAPASSAATAPSVSASATVSVAPMPPATPLTVIAMKATISQGGKQHTLELKADGSLLADGKAAAKITGAEMDDANGQAIVSVNGDNTLKISGQTSQSSVAKLNDSDAIEVNGATIISVADDGTVTLVGADGKPDKSGKMKFSGFKPTARRTACVIVFGMLIPMKMTSTVSLSSPPPATSAAPAKK